MVRGKGRIEERRRMNQSQSIINHFFSSVRSSDQNHRLLKPSFERCRISSQPPQRPRSRRPWKGEWTSRKKRGLGGSRELLSSQLVKGESWKSSTVSSTTEPIPIIFQLIPLSVPSKWQPNMAMQPSWSVWSEQEPTSTAIKEETE